ncbi:hypothetical protein DPMN_130540 [Dreissena polymorpha]|uniref:CCHC-type domain-containing protein n=1 Tax=Dreissena polymorpha TaxID=45954 RepID=A0A9D4JZ89_DREPO|nr:hypothetical protein DPMN_130540 [Dreissena polymorpha]
MIDDAVERTVKVHGKRGASMIGVINILTKNGVADTDVEWISSGPPGSLQYDVTFKEKDKCLTFLKCTKHQSVTHNNVLYRFLKCGKQIVHCRVHWLPAFVGDHVIAEIFDKFGTVLSIEHDTLKVGDFVTHSGVRVITLEVYNNKEDSVPHMIEFECGARALITMRGRQPLCLYCKEVGHVRMNCPNNINAIFKQKESVVERPKTTPTDTETTEKKTIEAETKENEQPEPRQKDEEGY